MTFTYITVNFYCILICTKYSQRGQDWKILTLFLTQVQKTVVAVLENVPKETFWKITKRKSNKRL